MTTSLSVSPSEANAAPFAVLQYWSSAARMRTQGFLKSGAEDLRAGADGLLMTGCLCSAAKWELTRSEPDTIAA
jgi:hypothetical protein